MEVLEILILFSVPSSITGFFFWLLKRRMDRQDKERREQAAAQERRHVEREKNREKFDLMLMQSNRATVILSTATAKAVQRIPDAKCNGDMTKALEQADRVQQSYKEFLFELGLHSLYE